MPQGSTDQRVFDLNGIKLIGEIADAAMKEAQSLSIELPGDEREARQYLIQRIVQAIESGETDRVKLRDLALMPSLPL